MTHRFFNNQISYELKDKLIYYGETEILKERDEILENLEYHRKQVNDLQNKLYQLDTKAREKVKCHKECDNRVLLPSSCIINIIPSSYRFYICDNCFEVINGHRWNVNNFDLCNNCYFECKFHSVVKMKTCEKGEYYIEELKNII